MTTSFTLYGYNVSTCRYQCDNSSVNLSPLTGQPSNAHRQDCGNIGFFPALHCLDAVFLTSYQAAAEGISLNQSLVVPRKGINKSAYMELFPLSQGKIPALEGPGIKITETIAIAYVSRRPEASTSSYLYWLSFFLYTASPIFRAL